MIIHVIAVHGNGGGAARFARVSPHMPPDVRLHAITLPGFAGTPPDPALQKLHDYAAYLHRLVARAQHPRILLGTGIGGSIILEYLQHDARAVEGVILHAPVGARLETRRFPRLMRSPVMRAAGQWAFSSPLLRPLWRRLLFVDADRVPRTDLNRFFDDYRHCAVFGQMFDLITPDWWANLEPVKLPAALLWGERERVLTPEHAADFQMLLPRATLRVIPGWDHFPMLESPDEFAREIAALARELVEVSN